MNAHFKAITAGGFDLLALKDSELTFVMESTVRQLASLKANDDALIRFWGSIFVLLDEERRRRHREIAELNRLYFL